MDAPLMVHHWRRQVRDELLPDLHGHQANALADVSFAMTLAAHCHGGRIAACAPGDARPASVTRRIERLLANDRLDLDAAWLPLARATLAGLAGGPIVLILDETPNPNALLYVARTGCQWRALPHDLPPWRIVYWYFMQWKKDGTLDRLHDLLRGDLRVAEGRNRQPSAAALDSQSVETTEKGGSAATMRESRSVVASGTSWSTRSA